MFGKLPDTIPLMRWLNSTRCEAITCAAIEVPKEELDIFEKEWNFNTGESADVVRREISRLERKMQ